MPDKHEVGGSSPLSPINFLKEEINQIEDMISSKGFHYGVISSAKQISLTFVST